MSEKPKFFERRPVWAVVNAVLALIIAGGLVVGGILGWRVYQYGRLDALHADAVDAARTRVTNFMTTSVTNVDADLQRIRDGATGTFGDSFQSSMPSLREAIVTNQSVSTGTVLSSAFVDGDTDSATVILACDASITNSEVKEPAVVHYRIQVEMALVDGNWLIGELEFIA